MDHTGFEDQNDGPMMQIVGRPSENELLHAAASLPSPLWSSATRNQVPPMAAKDMANQGALSVGDAFPLLAFSFGGRL